jgi:LysR family transcriptional regulator, cys regulon transcriptional activator
VRLNLHQGTSEQIAEMVAGDRIDCAIATGSEALFMDLTLLPCYRWHRTVIVPRGHPLASGGKLTLRALAAYPLISYTFSFTGPSSLHEAFAKAGLVPNVAITARDADVIQTYVRLGLGVGIVAHMAVDPEDPDLVAVDASHVFAAHTTWLGFRRGTLLRKYMYDFAQLLAPHLDRRLVERAHRAATAEEVAQLFADIALPER